MVSSRGLGDVYKRQMQNGSDPFDARELAAASREAMAMGISKEALVGAMHRSEETVQLYLDLGTMSHRVQDAVHKGKLSLGTAGLMRQLEKEQIELALEGVLYNPLTKEPMSEAQARVYIENAFLKPKKQAKEWAVVSIKLKRKLVADGLDVGLLDVVAWEDRENFVTEGALPMTALARCEEHIEDKLLVNPAVPMTWGELARSHGVPWHLCPAPVIETRHLLLVKRSAVMDADDVAPEGGWTVKGKAWRAAQAGNPAPTPTPTPAPAAAPAASEGGGVGGGGEGGGDEVEAEADEVAAFDLSLIHISEPTRRHHVSRMPSSA